MDNLSTSFLCYICDNTINCKGSDKLLCKQTKTTRVSFPKVISTLISDEFVLIVGKEDVICEQCTDMVNRLDELQYEVSTVRKILSQFLAKKYHIPIYDPFEDFGKETQEIEEQSSNKFLESNFNEKIHFINYEETKKDFLDHSLLVSSVPKEKQIKEAEEIKKEVLLNCSDNVSFAAHSSSDDLSLFATDPKQEPCSNIVDKGGGEATESTYLMCELCHSLFKTLDEINRHVCSNNVMENGDVTIDITKKIDKGSTVLDNLSENELTRKEIKLNLCCFICDAILPSRSDLALHILSHYPVKKSKKKGTVCPVCDASYTSLIDFMNHYDMHVDVTGITKKVKESAVSYNKINNTSGPNYPCPFCDESFSSNLLLNDHLKSKHNINTCYHCNKEFPSDLKLKEHLVIHEAKIKPNQCEYCLLRFNSIKELEIHIESTHFQIKTTKACPLCRKKCGSSISVKSHVLKCHLIPVLQQEIRDNYSHGSDLVNDMKNIGASENFIKSIMHINKSSAVENPLDKPKIIINVEASDVTFCLLCGFSTKNTLNLDRHREKHSARKIQCPLLCEHLSCDSEDLTVHLSESHDVLVSENCCVHCLNEPEEDLALHMKALHGKFYSHLTCYVCKEMFFSKENLKYHFSITHLILQQQFEEKGNDIDDNSVDPFETENREAGEDSMSNELTVALESISHKSPQPCDSPGVEISTENSADISSLLVQAETCTKETPECNKEKELENVCLICRKECLSEEELALHSSKHSAEAENTSCCFCASVLYDSETLKQHLIKEHPQNMNKYCFSCGQLFNSKLALVKHLNSDNCFRVCFICNKQFKKITLFVQHLSYSHRKDLKCFHCKKMCRSIKHLSYHEALHERYKGKMFKCEECGKTFLTPNSLKSHSVSHTGNYPFVCEFCGRGFLSSYGLSEHRASHTGDIRYCCEICGKSFCLYDTYHRHRRQHDNPFPAQCSECGVRFRNASRVAEHKRKVHTGERPYACPYCPMSFNVTSSYRIHLCKHTRVYPYNCDICKRGFASRFKFANHCATRHNDHSFVTSKTTNNNSSEN